MGRETPMGCLLYMLRLGIKPTTQARALTGSHTGNLSGHRMVLIQLSHSSRNQ